MVLVLKSNKSHYVNLICGLKHWGHGNKLKNGAGECLKALTESHGSGEELSGLIQCEIRQRREAFQSKKSTPWIPLYPFSPCFKKLTPLVWLVVKNTEDTEINWRTEMKSTPWIPLYPFSPCFKSFTPQVWLVVSVLMTYNSHNVKSYRI